MIAARECKSACKNPSRVAANIASFVKGTLVGSYPWGCAQGVSTLADIAGLPCCPSFPSCSSLQFGTLSCWPAAKVCQQDGKQFPLQKIRGDFQVFPSPVSFACAPLGGARGCSVLRCAIRPCHPVASVLSQSRVGGRWREMETSMKDGLREFCAGCWALSSLLVAVATVGALTVGAAAEACVGLGLYTAGATGEKASAL
ncbi:hypothetical protein Maes01_00578 [Microbulbifer aestuariivivens]|uniref:Uncharacterized protein n=1 Tax=Microbulbifer aestuariivivens TaxID=1908308 RepID=A0ABP9WLF3_9GAMM